MGAFSTTASPYPGWYYALPLILALVLLAVATWLALARVARTPSLPGAGLAAHDRAWRVVSIRVLVSLVAATVTMQLGGVLVIAGTSVNSVAGGVVATGVATDGSRGLQLVAIAAVIGGLLALGASVVWCVLAVLRGLGLRHSVLRDAREKPAGEGHLRMGDVR